MLFAAVIFGMFVVTYSVRSVLFARAHRITLPDWMEQALGFVPVAVLTAIITPMILMPQQSFTLALDNPWLWGSLAAFGVGLWRQQALLTITAGVVVFFASKALLA